MVSPRYRSTTATPPAKEEEHNYGDGPYYEEPYQEQTLANQCCAEFFGTFTVVLIGVGAECVVLYLGGNTSSASSLAASSSFAIACAWAIGSTLGIYISGPISGGHVNPAVSLSFALVRPTAFPFSKIIPFWISQLLGGMLAGLVNLMLFHQAIQNFENSLYPVPTTARGGGGKNKNNSIKAIVPSSFLNLFSARDGKDGTCCLESASAFGNYWSLSDAVTDNYHACFIEAFGTAFIVFIIFMVTSPQYTIPGAAVPPIVAIAVGAMVAILGPLTGAGLNPARDLGPRLVTLAARWGAGSMKDFLPYLVGPLIGGPLGAFLAEMVVSVV